MKPPDSAAVPAFDLLIFGGGGDLSFRKLLPALLRREDDGQLPPPTRIFALGRRAHDRADYLAQVRDRLGQALADDVDGAVWDRFLARIRYLSVDGTGEQGWAELAAALADGANAERICYFATDPALFGPISQRLSAHGLATSQTRVVLEKPIGHDLASSRAVNDAVGQVFAESQIYRIDHYLGKETVQNLMALRFANTLFERAWHRGEVDHVQITVAEDVGVAGRGGYYDGAGALRDMVQNHLLQLLCLVAMEPPATFSADAVRGEKLKVLTALRPLTEAVIDQKTVRGQYRAGAIDGVAVPGYLEEVGNPDSATETFVALKADIDNWRWAGVPFFLRTGKRLAKRCSEIVIQFRAVPHVIFPTAQHTEFANRLVIRLQPDEGIHLHMKSKRPGPGGMQFLPTALNLSFAEVFKGRTPDAYERLLMDVARGNQMLFMRRDEVEAAWRWIDGIQEGWRRLGASPKPYTAGSWGPSAAIGLIERDGRAWFEDTL